MSYIACNKSNYTLGRSIPIEYIVIHYTANNGDTAKGNCNYFANNIVKASAHYFVDENSVWQSVAEKDTAWHCGGVLQGSGGHMFYKKCMNSNSIGIELCSRKDSNGNYYFKEQTLKNTSELVRDIMKRRNIPIERVIRHYDVTGKICPAPLINETEWKKFKQMIKGDFKMFPDVKENDYAYKHIKKLKECKIVNGDENGNFNPDAPITRRDMAIISANLLTYMGK